MSYTVSAVAFRKENRLCVSLRNVKQEYHGENFRLFISLVHVEGGGTYLDGLHQPVAKLQSS